MEPQKKKTCILMIVNTFESAIEHLYVRQIYNIFEFVDEKQEKKTITATATKKHIHIHHTHESDERMKMTMV